MRMDGWTDEQTNMRTLIFAFHNFEKACKNGLNIGYLERDQTTDSPKEEVRILSIKRG